MKSPQSSVSCNSTVKLAGLVWETLALVELTNKCLINKNSEKTGIVYSDSIIQNVRVFSSKYHCETKTLGDTKLRQSDQSSREVTFRLHKKNPSNAIKSKNPSLQPLATSAMMNTQEEERRRLTVAVMSNLVETSTVPQQRHSRFYNRKRQHQIHRWSCQTKEKVVRK